MDEHDVVLLDPVLDAEKYLLDVAGNEALDHAGLGGADRLLLVVEQAVDLEQRDGIGQDLADERIIHRRDPGPGVERGLEDVADGRVVEKMVDLAGGGQEVVVGVLGHQRDQQHMVLGLIYTFRKEELLLLVVKIGHRKDIYDDLNKINIKS